MGAKKSKEPRQEPQTLALPTLVCQKCKIIFTGPQNSGKSSTIQSINKRRGFMCGTPTVGIDYEHIRAFNGNTPVIMRVYDINEGLDNKFFGVVKDYYSSPQIRTIFVFYSVNDKKQFDGIDDWM